MKIGFDISQTGNSKAGCGFFADNLISHLAEWDKKNQYTLYQTFGDHFWDSEYRQTYAAKTPNFHYGLHHKNAVAAKKFWQAPPANYEAALGNVDILHANNFFCPPKLRNGKLIYTLYDLSFMEYPDCSTEHNRIACYDGIFKASLTADYIVAISEYTRQHFLTLFPHFPKDRISVVYPASRFTESNNALEPSHKLRNLLPERFWLSVGTLEPRKNIKYLLRVYAKLKKMQHTYPLVLAGKQGWMIHDLEKTLMELGIQNDVHVLGYVDNEELQWLYQHCFYLIYPSLFEGFGLPVLEAMTLGAPVITSHSSSLPEVAGSAGILVDPLQEDELVHAMIRVSSELALREQFKKQSYEQAKLFSWEKSAKAILSLYEKVANEPECNRSL
ncbi:MAG: glycosyltransferase family 1 protein [Gammaproteobacteria bacterium]|nr:glycosyltransferase family 1 protein [Gammaproteobacteria bacterium]